VVVSYGITSRVAQRALQMARKQGIRAGKFRLISAWPFPSQRIAELAGRVKAFVVPELNMGQMVQEVERAVAQGQGDFGSARGRHGTPAGDDSESDCGGGSMNEEMLEIPYEIPKTPAIR